MEVGQAMDSRRSYRVFTSRPVERELVEEVLRKAGRAPSALNLQPWEVTVVMGEELERLARRLVRAYEERSAACTPGATRSLPRIFQERRRRSFGPLARTLKQEGLSLERFVGEGSCRFYGAPVAILICMDGGFSRDRYLCLGVFLGYLLLAAQDLGLATCPVGLITAYEEEIRDQVNIPEDKRVVIGVAMGYPDRSSPLAGFSTPRDPLENFVRWFV
ncbi:MAG: nitroreductase [Deltaproteobacteria bacterium]|nr:nitroreductase [Deltaproteobacteria bacterium]MBW2122261.1 nitroreductase [Deltaproteobacteria bacterium]